MATSPELAQKAAVVIAVLLLTTVVTELIGLSEAEKYACLGGMVLGLICLAGLISWHQWVSGR